jgi:hypothetical protein
MGRRRFALFTMWPCGWLLSACGGPTADSLADGGLYSPTTADPEHDTGVQEAGVPDSDTTDRATKDPPASDTLASDTTPITGLTIGAWTWVPFPRALCRDGSSTGIGVNLGNSDHLMIFVEGGGACFNLATCNGNPSSFRWCRRDFDPLTTSRSEVIGYTRGTDDLMPKRGAALPTR